MMRRRQFIAGAAMASFAGAARAAKPRMLFQDPLNGRWGGEEVTAREFAKLLRPLDPDILDGTILQVLNAAPNSAHRVVLDNLPSIMTQGTPTSIGSPGSCEADSFGYCLGAYTAARKPNGSIKWDAGLARNQPSAAWLYHWQHVVRGSKDCPGGSGATPYVQQLVSFGAPSTADFPYNPNDDTTVATICGEIDSINVSSLPADASRLLIGSYKGYSGIQNQKATYLDTFRSLIRHGHAIAFTGLVPKQYGAISPPLTNDAYTAPNGFSIPSGHGQTIVGFDDGKGPNGAFLVQNSFSADWNPGPANNPGHNGRIWYDYDAFFAGQAYAVVAYPNNDAPPSGTRLTASTSGAPRLFLSEARRSEKNGKYYLPMILHCDGAVNISEFSVTGPGGHVFPGSIEETMRFGYLYLERNNAFNAGRYQVSITASTVGPGSTAVTYTGAFDVA